MKLVMKMPTSRWAQYRCMAGASSLNNTVPKWSFCGKWGLIWTTRDDRWFHKGNFSETGHNNYIRADSR